jgi:hypothetical protein
MTKLRIVTWDFGWEIRSRGRFATTRRFPSPGWYPVLTCTRTPRTSGICPSFKSIFWRLVPNPYATICFFLTAVVVERISWLCREERRVRAEQVCGGGTAVDLRVGAHLRGRSGQ